MQDISDTYEVLEKIGSGGGGTVYRAFHKRLQKDVVIKQIHQNITNLVNCRQEVDILKNLHHQYLPQVIDFLEMDGQVFTVMDYIPGESFQSLLDRGVHFTQEQVIFWGSQLVDALTYLHAQNPQIIHGDIKPDNVMLTLEGNICLIDFNISGVLEGEKVKSIGISNGYSPLEQYPLSMRPQNQQSDKTVVMENTSISDSESAATLVMGEEEKKEEVFYQQYIDERSDLYSCGATFYHLLAGKRPEAAIKKVTPIEEIAPGISDGFAYIINKCMEKMPKDRFQNAQELKKSLDRVEYLDKQYKRFAFKEHTVLICFMVLLALSTVSMFYGKIRMQNEKEELFQQRVEQAGQLIEQDHYEDALTLIEQAETMKPNQIILVYERMMILRKQEQWNDLALYAEEENILDYEDVPNDTYTIGVCCGIAGEAEYHMENNEQALEYYKKAKELCNEVQFYCNYAVLLAWNGETAEAEAVLSEAVEKGIAQDSIFLSRGEISYLTGKYELAREDLLKCIENTDDDYLKMRAYIQCAHAYEEENLRENVTYVINLLEEACNELPEERLAMIRSQLVEAYDRKAKLLSEAGETTEELALYRKEISIMETERADGRITYQSMMNLSELYKKTDDLKTSGEILLELAQQYGDDYLIYKRLAMLELVIQDKKKEKNKDYHSFGEYYVKALELYQNQEDGKDDADMEILGRNYELLQSNGYIE